MTTGEGTRRSLNEAAKHLSAASLTFVVTASFLGITAFSITHSQLLIGHRVQLPLLDVEVSVDVFSVVAPVMVVLFHVVFLVQVYLLAREARRLGTGGAAGAESETEVLLPTIFVQVFNPEGLKIESSDAAGGLRWQSGLWLVARLLLAVILVIMPLTLLAVIQWRFVPYHSFRITLFHQVLTTIDVAACFGLVPLILTRGGGWWTWWRSGWVLGDGPRYFTRALFLAFLGSTLFFTWFLAVVPWTLSEALWGRRLPLADELQRDLRLAGVVVVTEVGPGCSPLRPPVNLAGRNLRGADLSHARLVGVDLRGADLRDARLVNADLRCADLSPRGSGELIHLRGEARRREAMRLDPAETGRARLAGADLSGADLRGAWLELADLRGTDLSGADLRGVQAIRADLRSAGLQETLLAAGDLSYARLDGAILDRADAACASWYGASARGIRAVGLGAEGGDLRRADLRGAALAEARLSNADLADAWLLGSDLRGARLQAARALDLRAVDLRWAQLEGATAIESGTHPSLEVDARGVVIGGLAEDRRWPTSEELRALARDLEGLEAGLAQVERCEERSRRAVASNGDSQPFEPHGWRLIPVAEALRRPQVLSDQGAGPGAAGALASEADLHLRLLTSIGTEACDDLPQAALLVLRARGCVPPRDPMLEARFERYLDGVRERPESCPALVAALEVADSALPPPPSSGVAVNLSGSADPELRGPGLAQTLCAEIGRRLREKIRAEP